MKNYYEILEVNRNASPEIIKVAYKLLVKKNHPDLKEGEEKQIAEEKIKEINEAYDVLSNPEEKAKYDQSLINEFISQEQYNIILKENMKLKKELKFFNNLYNKNNYAKRQYSNMYKNTTTNNNIYKNNNTTNNYSKKNNTQPNYTTNRNNIKNNKFKPELSEHLKTIIALLLTFLIIFIILNIPFINEFIINSFGSSYLIFFIAIIVFYIYFFKNKQ